MNFRLRRPRLADAAEVAEVAEVYVASWKEAFADLMPPRVLNLEQVARRRQDLHEQARRWWLSTGTIKCLHRHRKANGLLLRLFPRHLR